MRERLKRVALLLALLIAAAAVPARAEAAGARPAFIHSITDQLSGLSDVIEETENQIENAGDAVNSADGTDNAETGGEDDGEVISFGNEGNGLSLPGDLEEDFGDPTDSLEEDLGDLAGDIDEALDGLDGVLDGTAGETEEVLPLDPGGQEETLPVQDAGEPESYANAYTDQAGNLRVGEGASLPAWYPVTPDQFKFYHDDTAPRVADAAGIFSAEAELRMETRLKEIRSETGKDIVVYTDNSAYGKGQDILAADFFDFNGYGCGDEFEGVCLFICMDPEDRGWWVSCSGPETMKLYTEQYANEMDDVLYSYMASGEYEKGVADWIENFRMLYVKGMPFAPEWYPGPDTAPAAGHDSNAPRVRDYTGTLTDEQLRSLTDAAKKISDKYGKDVVICLAQDTGGLRADEYAKLYYEYCGYGFGENSDGIVLTMFRRADYGDYAKIYASGSGAKRLSSVNAGRMLDAAESSAYSGDYYEGMNHWLDQLSHMERTGRVPRSLFYWIMTLFGSAAAGTAFGGISLSGAKSRMAVPKPQADADMYLVTAALMVSSAGERLIDVDTSRRYIAPAPKNTGGSSPSSSSSSGSSTYHSSYTGSSGKTHSGSGRKF